MNLYIYVYSHTISIPFVHLMDNLISHLMGLASTSNIAQKHASAIFNNFNTPISFGVNMYISSPSGIDTMHSEHACIAKLKVLKGSYIISPGGHVRPYIL